MTGSPLWSSPAGQQVDGPVEATLADSSNSPIKRLEPPSREKSKAAHDPHTVLVRFKSGIATAGRDRSLNRVRGKIAATLSATGYVKVEVAGSAKDALATLSADPAVADVSLDFRRTTMKTPNDEFYATHQKYLATIRMPQAWDKQTSATGAVIAVLDTGVDGGHPDLSGRLVPGYNAVTGGTTTTDYNGHGTMVAGIAAANTNNTRGVAGVVWNGRIMPVDVFDGQYAYDSDIAAGVIWATDHGAKVINMSLGGSGENPALHSAIKYAVGKNVVVVVAAGNTGGGLPMYPAYYPEVLAVGATDRYGTLTDFSSWGDHLDIAAPGFDIASTYSRRTNCGSSCSYAAGSGTSFSAPMVAGVAALVRAKYPTMTAAQVVARLKSTARDAGPRGIDPYYGYGVMDASRALGGGVTADFPQRSPGAFEPNDTPARAATLTSSLTATMSMEGDVDWYKYQLSEPRKVNVVVTPPNHSQSRAQNFDPIIAVYDSNLRLVAEVDNPESANAMEQIIAPMSVGTFYVKITNYNGASDTRSYTLTMKLSSPSTYDFPPFVRATTIPIGATFPETVEIADVTGDGRLDALLTTSYYFDPENDWKLFVFVQQADGTLAAPVRYDTLMPGHPESGITTLDANGDGRTDVALAHSGGVEIKLQNQSGTLEPGVLLPDTVNARHIMAADMDGDGDQDLVVSRLTGVDLLTNGPVGSFTLSPVSTDAQGWGEVEVGDINGDENLDIASFGPSGGLAVHSRDAGVWTSTPISVAADSIEVADVTGDGRADIIAASYEQLQVLRQQSDGTLADPVTTSAWGGDAVEAADWDGDGRLDVFVARDAGGVTMYRQKADGTLATGYFASISVAQHAHQHALALGDLSGDGLIDVITAANYSGGLAVAFNANGADDRQQMWVRSVSVADFATNLPELVKLRVTMQRDLNPSSVTTQTVRLLDGDTGVSLKVHVTYDAETGVITINRPSQVPGYHRLMPMLIDGKPYRLVIGGVEDTTGNMHGGYSLTFVG